MYPTTQQFLLEICLGRALALCIRRWVQNVCDSQTLGTAHVSLVGRMSTPWMCGYNGVSRESEWLGATHVSSGEFHKHDIGHKNMMSGRRKIHVVWLHLHEVKNLCN